MLAGKDQQLLKDLKPLSLLLPPALLTTLLLALLLLLLLLDCRKR